jgi:hypothetical protein
MSIYKLIAPVQRRFRQSRMRYFADAFGLDGRENIIDVGGRKLNWLLIPQMPQVTLINIEPQPNEDPRFRYIAADGTCLPFADNTYDICYSNSVIEHVGGRDKRRAFAREIRRIAPRYYVQTPNKWFFLEPHTVGAFIHWLPRRWQRRLIRWSTFWGLMDRPNQRKIDALLDEIDLLTVDEMRALFPDAVIVKEKFCGLTKSIIAIRS